MNAKISFLQTFGIILVVIGHSFSTGQEPFLNDWIYSFHMPLFMFISGMLYKMQADKHGLEPMKSFFYKKSMRLLLPYFVISTLGFLCKIPLNNLAVRPTTISFGGYLHSLFYPHENAVILMWFLPTLFLIFVLSHMVLKLFKKDVVIVILLVLSFCYTMLDNELRVKLLDISLAAFYYKWWALGYLYFRYQDIVNRKLWLANRTVCFLLLLLTVAGLYFLQSSPYYPTAKIFLPIVGILFSISLTELYCKTNLSFLSHLYGYSFQIYLLSWFAHSVVNTLGYKVFDCTQIIVSPISIVLGIYMPLLFAKIAEKNKYLSTILGIKFRN